MKTKLPTMGLEPGDVREVLTFPDSGTVRLLEEGSSCSLWLPNGVGDLPTVLAVVEAPGEGCEDMGFEVEVGDGVLVAEYDCDPSRQAAVLRPGRYRPWRPDSWRSDEVLVELVRVSESLLPPATRGLEWRIEVSPRLVVWMSAWWVENGYGGWGPPDESAPGGIGYGFHVFEEEGR